MQKNWTTKSGKAIEISVTHKDGDCVETKISINGEWQKGRIEKANGIWAVAVALNGQSGYISLPAEVKSAIDTDCAASKSPISWTEKDEAYQQQVTRDYLFAKSMQSANSDL